MTLPDTSDAAISTLPFIKEYMATLEQLVELNMLNECTVECTRQSRWKETTQRYIADMLIRNVQLQDEVLHHRYKVSPTVDFRINERGHIRNIEAPVVRDRNVQKSIMKNVLTPTLRPYIIYDNYASLKQRGTAFARKRFEIMLRRYIAQHGTDGYVLLGDFAKYFESISHAILKRMIAPRLINEPQDVIELIHYMIDTSSHSEYGLNLGSEAPQIFAVYYLTPIDIYVKVVRGVKYYGHYMDDFFSFAKTKEELADLLGGITEKAKDIHLCLNSKKTHITKLSDGFTFLQIRYTITDTGKILKRPTRCKIIRERRRLKAFRRMYDKGRMTEPEIYNCYQSWRGSVIRDHNVCHCVINKMDALYRRLFPQHEERGKPSRKAIVKAINKEIESNDIKYCLT